MKGRFNKYTPIYLEWVDSSHTDGWTTEIVVHDDLTIKTVGFYHSENDNSVTILQSYAVDERCFDAVMTIPKVAIKVLRAIKEQS